MGKAETSGRAAWAAALDAMETALDDAARSMAVSASSTDGDGDSEWVVPRELGALPSDFAERARDLLTNQQKLIGELEQARSLTLKHLVAVRSVPPERDAGASVYLDVDG